MKKITLVLCWVLTACVECAELPTSVIPQGVGINIHFTRGHAEDLDLIAAAGFKWVRMDFSWSSIERTKGVYDWSAYEELTANLEKRGIHALYILDYSNPLYEETVVSKNPITGRETRATASPQKPESIAAFARWAAAAAEHFKGRSIIWEIWNEPNIFFWQPKPDARQYSALALATAHAIRQADPNALVVGPATSEVPLKFLEDCFAAGLLDVFNAITVHPYRDYRKPPETAADDYAKLRELIQRYAKTEEKKHIPIFSGEWGYATHSRGVSLDTQAAFAVRQQLANLLAEVPLSIWYDWKNDGPDPDEREHNFGVVTADLKPKPAYTAIKVLTRELSGHRIAQRIDVGNPDDYILLTTDHAGARKLVAWTTGAVHQVSIRARMGEKTVISALSGLGQQLPVVRLSGTPASGNASARDPNAGPKVISTPDALIVELGAMPIYITLGDTILVK